MKKKIAIIGSGISGLSAAAYSTSDGNEVHVFEKNATPGGRARQFVTDNGYTFDMGPSWYWMPDIIEGFFKDFGHKSSDFYTLITLDPQFEMIFEDTKINIPKNYNELKLLFEHMEDGAGKKLDAFMKSARFKYEVGMREFVYKPCHSWLEFMSPKMAYNALRLDLLTNFRTYVSKFFTDSRLKALMEFPVIFLGASPKDIPALYSLMNYGGYMLGTWYPMGGFYQLILAMKSIAGKQGVQFHFNSPVQKIVQHNDSISILVHDTWQHFDAVIASSDYHHSETLLDPGDRNYDEAFWSKKTFAPSCLIYYLGFKEKIPNLKHHTLFFDSDFDKHIESIYDQPGWPENPLFYVCCPSKTDPGVAPYHHENVFLLMPLAPGLQDDEETREVFLHKMINRLEQHTGTKNLASQIDFKKSYCVRDFKHDYNAFKGNAYGLANTLSQTAVLKPSIKNKKLSRLIYTGQLTVPGPGVPPSIISGKIAATELSKIKFNEYEKTI
jgi:phytoene desaturase